MDLKQAVGVNAFRQTPDGREISHEDFFDRVVLMIGGVDAIEPLIPFKYEEIEKALATDPHLNNLAMSEWDRMSGVTDYRNGSLRASGPIWKLYKAIGVDTASNADGVCLLKHASKLLVLRENNPEEYERRMKEAGKPL